MPVHLGHFGRHVKSLISVKCKARYVESFSLYVKIVLMIYEIQNQCMMHNMIQNV